MTDTPIQNHGSDENAYHMHARLTVELCLSVDLSQVSANVFDSAYMEQMPEATKLAYQQLWKDMLSDPETRRRLLATMLIERCIDLYHNTDDLLTDLVPEEKLVNGAGNRIELLDLALKHLAPGAPYYFWKNKEATESTFLAEEGLGGLDVEALHACLVDDLAHIDFEEVEPDD
jgi:hypothetical protein